MPQSLRATIGRKTIDLFSTRRHWNVRNLTLQQECYLTSTRDFFRNTYGSIMLPPRQPRVFARLGSLAIRFIYVCVHSRSPVVLKLKESTVKTIVMVQCFAPDYNHQSESHMHVQIFLVSLSREKSR